MKRQSVLVLAGWGLLVFLLGYGGFTAKRSALDTGITYEEPGFQKAGKEYWETGTFTLNAKVPPLAKLVGGAIPHFYGYETGFTYRIGHVFLYCLTGALVAFILAFRYSLFSAVAWAGFFFLCPNVKAMASLNVADFDGAMWIVLAAFALWIARRRHTAGHGQEAAVVLAAFFLGLACATETTALFFVPVFALLAIGAFPDDGEGFKNRKRLLIWSATFLIPFAIGLFAAYRFSFSGVGQYAEALRNQFLRGGDVPRETAILGQVSSGGFWYFYLVSYAAKTPLAFLVVIIGTFATAALAVRREVWDEVLIFFVPAMLFTALLSLGKQPTGLRDVLPAVLLVYLGSAVLLKQIYDFISFEPLKSKLLLGVLGVALVSAFAADVWTVRNGAYLGYFNWLAPNPTRNFSRSNNDWGQGPSPSWQTRFPNLVKAESLSVWRELGVTDKKVSQVLVGASELSGLGSRNAKWFKNFSPAAVADASYEIFELSPHRTLEYFEAMDHPEAASRLKVNGCSSSTVDRKEIALTDKGSFSFPVTSRGLLLCKAKESELALIYPAHTTLTPTGKDLGQYVFHAWLASGGARFQFHKKPGNIIRCVSVVPACGSGK